MIVGGEFRSPCVLLPTILVGILEQIPSLTGGYNALSSFKPWISVTC